MTRVQLDEGAGFLTDVEIVRHVPVGRVEVRFPSGATLLVASSMLRIDSARYSTDRDQLRAVEAVAGPPVHLTGGQLAVLRALSAAGRNGLTDDDHEAINGLRGDSAGKRRLELCQFGFVIGAPEKRPTKRGALARVWRITAEGEDALVRWLARHRTPA